MRRSQLVGDDPDPWHHQVVAIPSERGSRFGERMQTVSAALRQSGRSLNDSVVGVAHAVLTGRPRVCCGLKLA